MFLSVYVVYMYVLVYVCTFLSGIGEMDWETGWALDIDGS